MEVCLHKCNIDFNDDSNRTKSDFNDDSNSTKG